MELILTVLLIAAIGTILLLAAIVILLLNKTRNIVVDKNAQKKILTLTEENKRLQAENQRLQNQILTRPAYPTQNYPTAVEVGYGVGSTSFPIGTYYAGTHPNLGNQEIKL